MSKFVGCGIIALAAVTASCSTHETSSHSAGRTLQFIGDSITVQSKTDLEDRFRARYDVRISAVTGADTWWQVGTIARDAARKPAIAVINLGTNDAARIGVAEYAAIRGRRVLFERAQTMHQVLARYDTFVAEFPPTTCLVFVTVNTHNPSWGPENAATINRHLRAVAPNLVDWDAALKASYFDTADNPHPNETGRQALLKLEDRAITPMLEEGGDSVITRSESATTEVARCRAEPEVG